jgi:phosphoribosylamine--glycine ligase
MRILVVGSGGREHALCWAIARSPLCGKLYCAPGNAGIAEEAELVNFKAEDVDGILAWVKTNAIDFVVVGPEAPLVMGMADRLQAIGVSVFGPSAAAAALEGSKAFSKQIMAEAGVPTAAYAEFTEVADAKAYLKTQSLPIVIKADGLAAGKGVIIAQTMAEAEAAVDDMLTGGVFGEAGNKLVIEEFMVGEEASFFALLDGKSGIALASAQDHKAVGEGDTGPNTGGMGAYSPAPVLPDERSAGIMELIVEPIARTMAARGTPYKGVLFAGLMMTDEGPKVVEFNVRFGDPECQVLMMRCKSDFLTALIATADGMLNSFDLRWKDETALTVVMAAEGYPGSYKKNTVIGGVDKANALDAAKVFHAGTARSEAGDLISVGGRVLNVTATGVDVEAAQSRAYEAVDQLSWPEGFCRRDIGWRAVGRG